MAGGADDPADGGWLVRLTLPRHADTDPFEAALQPFADSYSQLEADGGAIWQITAHASAQPDRAALETRIAAAAARVGIAMPPLTVEKLDATDWVAEYRRRIGPVSIGGFFIYPSHFEGAPPTGATAIRLDAGLAFGTGEHETTRGCLIALERLKAEGFVPETALDLGCGSAILAIAMAMLWPDAHILAADNDDDAAATAEENVAINGCSETVCVVVSDFFAAAEVTAAAPFRLIVANILAGPLVDHVDELATYLAPGGRLVLSGILARQAQEVERSCSDTGFALNERMIEGDWATLTFTR